MKNQKTIKLEQIGDYAWLGKTRRSWHLWIGNPFYIEKLIIPLKKVSRDDLIKCATKQMKEEKKRFAKEFPEVKWKTIKNF